MKKIYSKLFTGLCFFCLLGATKAICQTNPAAQLLPYTQNFATFTGSTTTYPAGLQGWGFGSTAISTSFNTAAPTTDQALIAATNASTTGFVGDMNTKIGILATGTNIKALCLAISTLSTTNITVSFLAATQRQQTTDRVNELGVQYRIGTTGTFTNITGSTYQNNVAVNNTTGTGSVNPVTVSFTLPAACENQPVVQLRWIQRDVSGAGGRPSFSIDDISIATATAITPTITVTPSTLNFPATIINTSATSQTYTVTGINLTNDVTISTTAPYSISIDNTNFSTSINIVKTDPTLATGKTIYVGFNPVTGGTLSATVTNASVDASSKSVILNGTGVGLINLVASPYLQNFNGIGGGLPIGVTVKTAATAGAIGTDAGFTTTPTAWNNATGAFKNFASGNNDESASSAAQAAFTDRAIGIRQTGALGDPGAAFVFQVANTTGKINFTLDFNLQSLDAGSPRVTTWRVDYGIGINPSIFIVPATTGTLTTGGSDFTNNPVHVDFGNALDNQSGIITVRIVSLTSASGAGNRPTSGIDDFKLSWEDPTAKTISLNTTAINFPATNVNTTRTQTYSIVSQTNLTDPILISTAAPYTISTDNITFSSNLSVAPVDAVSKTIYVKFSPTAVGVYNGSILHTSIGAVSKTVTLSGEAIDPSLLAFNFNNCSVSSIPGSGFLSINVTGSQKWGCSQYGRNSSNGVDVNGFSGGAAQTNDAWLISPALNLNSIVNIPVLSFYSRGEFSGPKIQLFVSTTYDGSSVPNIANWTEITTANFPAPPGSATTAWTLSDNIDLSAYKAAPSLYIAFRYTSSSVLNAARWSVDDIAITDQSSLLSVSPSQLSFGEVAVNTNSASQSIGFQAIGGTSAFTVTPPAGYQISADNITFITTGLVVPQATASTGTTLYIRFSPTVKALKIEGNVRVTATGLDKNVVFVTGSSYPKSETFDVAAYNISFFGSNSTNNAAPADVAIQVANISTVMQRLNMDVIAIEEMSNDAALAQLVGNLPGYASVLSNRWSYSFDPPDPTFPPQKIGFIYNTATMSLSTTEPPRVMFESMYDSARLNLPGHRLTDYPTGTPSSFWGSGRLPFMATFNVSIGCATRKVRLVVLHAKSGGTADGYIRRQYDVKVLKDSLDAYYGSDSVIVLGDYNDRIVTSIYTGNPTSYLPFVNNPNYNILTLPLDQAGRTSFPSSNGLIDHVMVTNEFTSENIANSTDIEDPRLYIANYTATTASDHLPVFTRFALTDKNAPVITCTANITVSNSSASCGAIVNYTAPTATDNCAGVTVTRTAGPASGSTFPVGVTTITYTATDASGNSSTCSFTVTVNDIQAPVITCPSNIIVNNTTNLCSAVVNFTPTAVDNCSNFSFTQSSSNTGAANNSAACPAGITSWWRAYQLAAPAPITMDKVTFGIEIAEAIAGTKPVTIRLYTSAGAFPGGVRTQVASQTFNIAPQTNTLFTATFTTPPTVPGNSILVVEVSSDVAQGRFFIGGNTLAETAPSYISAPGCGIATPVTAASIAFPDMHIVLNASGFIPLTITSVPASGTAFPVGTTTVTTTATDLAGNSSNCTFTVKVNDTQAPAIVCPTNITANTPVGSCTAPITYVVPTATDNCPGVVVTRTAGPASGSAFPVGVTTVTHTATDAAGNVTTCSFTVTVSDVQLPVISAQPTNKSVCNGLNTTFTVTASNAVSYQWQQFIGGVWTNVAGATANTLSLNAVTLAMNTNSYRVNVIGLCTTVTSGFATLSVNPLPTISLTATNSPVLLPTQTTSIVATVVPTGGSFAWFKNGAPLVPAVTTGVLSNLTIDNAGTYRAVYTDLNGCVNTSADLVISAEASTNLFIAPNPNFGQFSVRYYNQANERLTVSVFNSNGTRVYQKAVTTTFGYTKIDVDLLTNAPGVYVVMLNNASGKLLGQKQIIVGRR